MNSRKIGNLSVDLHTVGCLAVDGGAGFKGAGFFGTGEICDP